MEYTEFAALAKRCNESALKAFYEYGSVHARLGIKDLFSPERMSTPDGVVKLSETVSHLREITSKYKQTFIEERKSASQTLAEALEKFPVEQRMDPGRVINIIEWQFDSQDRFYANRERWLHAVGGLCSLIQAQWKGTPAVNHADSFSALMDDLQETQMLERQLLSERESRLRMSADMLGVQV